MCKNKVVLLKLKIIRCRGHLRRNQVYDRAHDLAAHTFPHLPILQMQDISSMIEAEAGASVVLIGDGSEDFFG